jgi:hypothetical protein
VKIKGLKRPFGTIWVNTVSIALNVGGRG